MSLENTPSKEEGIFVCPHSSCKRSFSSKRNLTDHFRSHHQGTRPHICTFPQCGKSFLRPAHLTIHYRIHTGEKPFECEFPGCGKRWNQKSALKQHMRSHTGEKPFPCTSPNCSKHFSTSSSCKRHVLTHKKQNNNQIGSGSSCFVVQPQSPTTPSIVSTSSSPPSSPPSISFSTSSLLSASTSTSNLCSASTSPLFAHEEFALQHQPQQKNSNNNLENVVSHTKKRSFDEMLSSDQEQPHLENQSCLKLTKVAKNFCSLTSLSVTATAILSMDQSIDLQSTKSKKMDIHFLLN